MTASPLAKIDYAGTAAVRLSQRSGQAVRIVQHEDQVDVVVYQAPSK